MKIKVTKRLLREYPHAKFLAVIAENFGNANANAQLEKEKSKIQQEIRKIKDITSVSRIKEHGDFHERFGKSYPIEFQFKSIVQGKNIPTESTLKDVLFMTEMKHHCIISGHEMDDINQDLIFDLSSGGEEYLTITDRKQSLKPNDIVLTDNGKVITSRLYGPDSSTKITDRTKSCLYLFWFSSPISTKETASILSDFKKYLSIIENKSSKVVELEVVLTSGQEAIVTPWEVKGEIDYDKLIKEFGVSKIDDRLLSRIKKR